MIVRAGSLPLAADAQVVRRPRRHSITAAQQDPVTFRKRPSLVWGAAAFGVALLAIGLYNWRHAGRHGSLGTVGQQILVIIRAVYWLLVFTLSAAFGYIAVGAARFRLDVTGVHEWHLTGIRLLRWSEVTRCYLLRERGMGIMVLCRGDEQWKVPAAAFKDPERVFEFVDGQLPATASRRADA